MAPRAVVILLAVLVLPAALAAQPRPAASPADRPAVDAAVEFVAGRRAYEQQRYAEAVRRLAPLLYPNILLAAEEQIVDAHKVLAISHLMLNDREAARKEFVSLLGYRPDYVLDPTADPPAAVSYFEYVKRELDERSREARERQAREEERRRIEAMLANRPVVYVDRVRTVQLDRRLHFSLFIPFGWGQFENGQRGKAWLFLSTEAALAATSITTWTLYQLGQGAWTHDDDGTIRALRITPIVTGAAFLGMAVWGIIDAIVHAPPRETVTTSEPKPPPKPTGAALTVTPGGVALQGAF